jgi:acyl dehydratase
MPTRVIGGVPELERLVGQEVGVSDWVEITQDMINRFADLTSDHQWIHLDIDRAQRESPFKATIAHGFLTLSMLSHLMHDAVEVRGEFKLTVNYGFNKVRFPSPVPAGSRIRARVAVAALKPFDGGVEVAWAISIEVENREKPAVAAEWVTRMYSK